MHCFVLYDGGITLECWRMAFIAFCNETSQNYIIIQVNKTERNCLNNRPYALTSRLHNNDAMLGVKTCRAARTCFAGRAHWRSPSQSVCAPGPARRWGMQGFALWVHAWRWCTWRASFDPQHHGGALLWRHMHMVYTLWKSDATSREHIARTSLKSLSHPRIGSRTFALWRNPRVMAVENVRIRTMCVNQRHSNNEKIRVCERVWRHNCYRV